MTTRTDSRLRAPSRPRLPQELILHGNLIITSDHHALYTNRACAEQVLTFTRQFNIDQVAIVGDWLNFDRLSHFPHLTPPDPVMAEVKAARAVAEFWLRGGLKKIYACRGNHDARLSKALDGEIDMEAIGDLILPGTDRSALILSSRDRMWLRDTTGRDWLLAHQREYRKASLVVANALAQKYQCNVVSAHQHHCAIGMDDFGRYVIADNPCMTDGSRTPYKDMQTTLNPEWAVGFTVILAGVAHLYVHGRPLGFKGD